MVHQLRRCAFARGTALLLDGGPRGGGLAFLLAAVLAAETLMLPFHDALALLSTALRSGAARACWKRLPV